jgi:quinol-cytochrome oxidoreductase complex cytochrome b subunit
MYLESARSWLDARIGLTDLGRIARKKEIPIHRHSIWYYLGGMTLFLFTVQVVTGILLLLYYRPSAEEAYESVQFLMAEVQFGWLVRSIHAWSANLMIFALFVHLLSVLLLRAYRPPREITWLSGMALLGLSLGLGFTGYLLPWNTLALFATKVGTDIPGAVPVVGDFIRLVLRGGEDVTGATLTRFYGIHVAILPALTTACLALHVYLVQRHGMSVPLGVDRGAHVRKMPFLPNFLLRDLIGWLVAVAVLVSLAAFMPTELGEKADPFASAPASIRPEWYFMFMFQTLKLLPAHVLGVEGETIGILAFGLGAVLLALVPFLDRAAARGERNRVVTFVSLALIVYMVAFTVWGYAAAMRG